MNSSAEVLPGIVERAVRFESAGERLAGVLSVPKDAPRGGTAVCLVHGWGSYRSGPHDMMTKLARRLASRGITVLRFDLHGRGESPGEFGSIDLDAMIGDAVAAAAYLRAQSGAARVAGVGLCSGGNVALAAAACSGAFDAVAALSALPFQSHKSAMQAVRRTGGLLRHLVAKALSPATWWRLVTGRVRVTRVVKNVFGGEGGRACATTGGTRNLKDSARDIMGALTRYTGHMLFVWGSADPEGMGAKGQFETFCSANGLEARFELVPGSNHNFYSLRWERELFALVDGFVA